MNAERRRTAVAAVGDDASRSWVEQLEAGAPRRDEAIALLHGVLLRVAHHELWRRRDRMPSLAGPEHDDLAHQAAADALVKILARLDRFRGESRFTTWAYKFVIFEVSEKVSRHAWRREPPSSDHPTWERRADVRAVAPADRVEQRARLAALSSAIAELPERQRTVFVAVALNDISIDVLALEIGSNRNAIYKNLFDARRNLRARIAAFD